MKKSNCFGEFAKYTTLNILGMIGLSCYILADTFFISKGLGTNGLTALNLAIPIYSFIHGCGLMIGMGGGIRYSITKGQEDKHMGNSIFTSSIVISAIFSVIFVLLGIVFTDGIVVILGADEAVFNMTKIYIRMILLFSPAFLLNNVMICFVRNDGAPQLSMLAMLGGSLFNIILDYIFIFEFEMGIFGAVFATCLAPIISIAMLSLHYIRKNNKFHFRRIRFNSNVIKCIFSNGIPSLITEMSSGVVIIIFNLIILGIQGNTGVAAYGVIANISLVVISIYTGISQGIQPIISKNYGLGNKRNINAVLGYALCTMFVLSIIIYVCVYLGAGHIVNVFNSEQNKLLEEIAVKGLKLYFLACPFVGFNIIFSVYFTSIDIPLPAHIVSILRGFVIIIPMAFVLSSLGAMSGVWCAFPVTEFLVCILVVIINIKIIKNEKV